MADARGVEHEFADLGMGVASGRTKLLPGYHHMDGSPGWAEDDDGAVYPVAEVIDRRALRNGDVVPEPPRRLPPSPLDLAEALSAVEAFVRRFVVLTPSQHVAAVLWVSHTHAIAAADVTPYLGITSPEKRSGKTRLLEVIELLAAHSLRTANISDAALFRAVAEQPTVLLIDEADAIFSPRSARDDLRALLNSGFRRGADVVRVEFKGKQAELRHYDAFSAKALAGIGDLPDTIADRSIPIAMQRRSKGEPVERFRMREARAAAGPIRAKLAAWAATPGVIDSLRAARPEIPEALHDRAQDGWEPLLAIADAAGGEWSARARAAAVELHGHAADESIGVLLLKHCADAFAGRNRLTTAELLKALVEREDGPWAAWWGDAVDDGHKKGPASKLAKLLKPFGITPKTIRVDDKTPRGYEAESFADAWARYLPPPLPEHNSETSQLSDRLSSSVVSSGPQQHNIAGQEPVSSSEAVNSADGQAAPDEGCFVVSPSGRPDGGDGAQADERSGETDTCRHAEPSAMEAAVACVKRQMPDALDEGWEAR